MEVSNHNEENRSNGRVESACVPTVQSFGRQGDLQGGLVESISNGGF